MIIMIFNMIGGITSSAIQANQTKRDREFARSQMKTTNLENRYLADLGYSHDYKMWQRQNAYNHPSAQMDRLKAAGINPNMVFGGGSVQGNTAAPAPSYKAPTHQPQPVGPQFQIPQFQNIIKEGAIIDNVRASTENKLQDTLNKEVKEALQNIQVLQKNFDLGKSKKMWPYQESALKIKNNQGLNKLAEGIIKNANLKIDSSIKEQQRTNLGYQGSILEKEGKIKDWEVELSEKGMHKGDDLMWRKFAEGELGLEDLLMLLFGSRIGIKTPGLKKAKSAKIGIPKKNPIKIPVKK